MGAHLCGLRRSHSSEMHQSDEFVSGSQSLLAELLLNPQPSKNETKKKRVLQDSSDSSADDVIAKVKKLTMEEWLIASPGRPKSDSLTGSGEPYVVKHNQLKRVCPASSMLHHQADQDTDSCKPQNNIDIVEMGNCPMEVCEENVNINANVITKNGKRKKRVTFRLPQEADIIVFYSPKQELQGVQDSMITLQH